MEEAQVKRLICVTGFGAGDSRGRGGFLYNAAFHLLLGRVYDDKDVLRLRLQKLSELKTKMENLCRPIIDREYRKEAARESILGAVSESIPQGPISN
jgi:hypothetical protein